MDKQKAIAIFKQRITDLRVYENINTAEIQDAVLRAKVFLGLNTLNLNKKLLNYMLEPTTKKLS